MKNLLIVGFSLLVFVAVVAMNGSSNGIITLAEYPHAIALCQGDVPDEELVTTGDAHLWQKDGIMYTVNKGHLYDQEIEVLRVVATIRCAQY